MENKYTQREQKTEDEIKFTQKEQQAMGTMLKVFSEMQSERKIDPEDYDTLFGRAFNITMCGLIDLMYMCPETERMVYECGY